MQNQNKEQSKRNVDLGMDLDPGADAAAVNKNAEPADAADTGQEERVPGQKALIVLCFGPFLRAFAVDVAVGTSLSTIYR